MKIKQMMLGSASNLTKKTFFWNMTGSMLNALMSVVLLMIVTWVGGADVAGVFSYAFAAAQLMLTIGYYEMRPYQATDLKERYQFGDYLSSRVITCAAMIVVSIVYIAVNVLMGNCSPDRVAVVFLMCVFKLIDAAEDVFHGQFQQKGRLDVAGKAMSIRIFCSTAAFAVAFAVSHSLVAATVVAIAAALLCFVACNLTVISEFSPVRFPFRWGVLKSLFITCFPLFAGSFMINYIYNAPKFAINSLMADQFQTYYNILFMPASVINLFSGFVLKPLLTTLAENWVQGEIKKFRALTLKLILWIFALTVVIVAGGYLLGIPVLSLMYPVDLSPYRLDLVIALIGGGFSALSIILYYGITVIRKQQFILYGYSFVFVLALIFTPIFVRAGGIRGAVLVYMSLMILLSIVFLGILLFFVRREEKSGSKREKER